MNDYQKKHFLRFFENRISQRKIMVFFLCLLPILSCTRTNYHTSRTLLSSSEQKQDLEFKIESQPPEAITYIDSTLVGNTPVTVKAPYICKNYTYEEKTIFTARRTTADIVIGSIFLATSLSFGLLAGLSKTEKVEDKIGYSLVAAGTGIPGIIHLLIGTINRHRNGKTVSSRQIVESECPQKQWKLVVAKDFFLPAERVLSVSDAFKPYLVVLTPASTPPGGYVPPAAIDKAALLSSMAKANSAISSDEMKVDQDTKKSIEERMKNLRSQIGVESQYETASEDVFFTVKKDDIRMLEMTTEKDYCYIITATGEQNSAVFIGLFRGTKELANDMRGMDTAYVKFCSETNEPVRVTVSSTSNNTIGLRIFYLPK